MCLRCAPLALVLFVLALPATASWVSPFISEFHYDNAGGDVGEGVAVTGPHGLALAGWEIVLYNGANGRRYAGVGLDGVLDGGGGGLAEAYWAVPGIQNGPDALALVSPTAGVVDFVAYEAAVTAIDGVANGLTARLLPIAEDGASPAGNSLQRIGGMDEWRWVSAPATPGVLNAGLVAAAANGVPVVTVGMLWWPALAAWLLAASRRRPRPGYCASA